MAKGNHKGGGRSFRTGASQAKHVAEGLAAHGTARHGGGADSGTIKSIGAERVLKSDLAGAAGWLAARETGASLATMTREQAGEYLDHRAEAVRQSQLDSDRQSLDKMFAARAAAAGGESHQKFAKVKSEVPPLRHNKHYSGAQTAAIGARQNRANFLATKVIAATGCRPHELHTLRPAGAGHAADHRAWRDDRFAGREPGEAWLVTGKGGLTREVHMPSRLADEVRACQLPAPITVSDRGVFYTQKQYGIGGGNAWSASFTRASKAALGWSEGGHALRHTYVAERMTKLTEELGYRYEEARLVVSQELGHFRPDVLAWYGYP